MREFYYETDHGGSAGTSAAQRIDRRLASQLSCRPENKSMTQVTIKQETIIA